MKKDIAEKWITALRSGEYEQGKYLLHNLNNNTFCCLGILCELALQDGVDITVIDTLAGANSYDGCKFVLPLSVQNWSGMRSVDGTAKSQIYLSLSGLNDAGTTFEEVAEIIERNMEFL